ncbi:uncharacterized protein ALTATR162_LOCUS152 [Alternaria atra]|uniref:Asl1-like glycosyl hydrolase catalytic domain-containing protein n=1 Tax=Alternaria atra TaxID=119953 RepID=A0A8J2HUW6_9PLEO|nr:uncharacterized protein ALTATR162_LOCUS152 [Alternaria atra]CAG5137568.1 unnamed protein product [Alternaria atra]
MDFVKGVLLSLCLPFALALPAESVDNDNTLHSSALGCPAGLKNVVFNSGYSPTQFSQIQGASNYVTFGLGSNPGQIPMMAFASDVANAVSLVNSPDAPEFMLTFNEPDYSYMGFTPTMTPQQAADAIRPLLASPGTKTKFIAPVPAYWRSNWLSDFYAACGCQSFFHAYNIHVYLPTLDAAKSDISNFRNRFADKPLWVTEIAPGNANPPCSLEWPAVESYMNGLYSWGASTGWIEKIFWNTGNQIPDDTNVCNSYLLDSNGQPSPLLAAFSAVNCS